MQDLADVQPIAKISDKIVNCTTCYNIQQHTYYKQNTLNLVTCFFSLLSYASCYRILTEITSNKILLKKTLPKQDQEEKRQENQKNKKDKIRSIKQDLFKRHLIQNVQNLNLIFHNQNNSNQ